MECSRWRKLIKHVWWPGWVWVGKCFFRYWPTQAVLDKRPLNDCVCVFCLPKIITSINQYHATITDRKVLWSLNTGRITMPSNWWPLPVLITRSLTHSPVWARGRCRISPPRFLTECCKRQLNQVSLVLLYFRLSAFSDLYWVYLYFPVLFCLSVSVKWLAMKTVCEMTYTVSGGALNSTHTKTKL